MLQISAVFPNLKAEFSVSFAMMYEILVVLTVFQLFPLNQAKVHITFWKKTEISVNKML